MPDNTCMHPAFATCMRPSPTQCTMQHPMTQREREPHLGSSMRKSVALSKRAAFSACCIALEVAGLKPSILSEK